MKIGRVGKEKLADYSRGILSEGIKCHDVEERKISDKPSSALFNQLHHRADISNFRSKRCRYGCLSLCQR